MHHMANGTGRRGMVSATVVSWPHSPPLPLFQSQSVGVLQRVYIHAEIFSEFWVQQGDVGCKQSYQNVQWISSSTRHDKWCWLWTEFQWISSSARLDRWCWLSTELPKMFSEFQVPQDMTSDVGCEQNYQNFQWISSSARLDRWCWLSTELPKMFSESPSPCYFFIPSSRFNSNVVFIPFYFHILYS